MIGVSFALWSMTIAETATTNVLTSGCLSVTYADVGSAINLANQFPVTDAVGGSSTPYTFKVTNNCANKVQFDINLNILSTTSFPLTNLKFKYDNEAAAKVSTLGSGTIGSFSNLGSGVTVREAKRIKSGVEIAANGYSQHTLRFWLDENTPLDASNQNKKFEARISVVATPKA